MIRCPPAAGTESQIAADPSTPAAAKAFSATGSAILIAYRFDGSAEPGPDLIAIIGVGSREDLSGLSPGPDHTESDSGETVSIDSDRNASKR